MFFNIVSGIFGVMGIWSSPTGVDNIVSLVQSVDITLLIATASIAIMDNKLLGIDPGVAIFWTFFTTSWGTSVMSFANHLTGLEMGWSVSAALIAIGYVFGTMAAWKFGKTGEY
jgi:hypothetical protein